MFERPLELEVSLCPRSRYDVIDVTERIHNEYAGALDSYRRVLYCSHHTTAGYLDQRLARQLSYRREDVDPFMRQFQRMFPHGAGYRHDAMHLRSELTDEQRRVEPPNGDAHLTFIGSGLQNCVTYRHRPEVPVFFMDLDGEFNGAFRTRTTSIVAYNSERTVAELLFDVPVSRHAIDSVNLYDDRLGLKDRIEAILTAHPIQSGRIDISLDASEDGAGVTVNEYETLLMRHDLAEVLRDPVRFVARQGRRMLRDPRSVPAKSLGYARYDVVKIINRVLDSLGSHGKNLERVIARLMAVPAARRLHLKRTLSLAVCHGDDDRPHVVRGRYQTPILIQWRAVHRQHRTVRITLNSLE